MGTPDSRPESHHNHPAIGRRKASLSALVLCLLLAACALATVPSAPTGTPISSPATPSPKPNTATPSATWQPSPTFTPTTVLPVWQSYPGPSTDPSVPIPPPMAPFALPEDVQSIVLLGTDRNSPYIGRTDAIQLVLYSAKTNHASFLSLPPDLFVYLPGFTMQRLQIAYAMDGIDLLNTTLEYNFGIRPDHYLLVHLDNFSQLVDDLGGLEVDVPREYPELCDGIPAGYIQMDGETALCYVRYREGPGELDRSDRQQAVLKAAFLRLVQGGNLISLPQLHRDYKDTVESDLSLKELMDAIPLALNLGVEGRIANFNLGEEGLTTWQLPGQAQAAVFLPVPDSVRDTLQMAVDFVESPAPQSSRVVTLAYELTVSPTATNTPTATMTPTRTRTPIPTYTKTRTITPTRTKTQTRTPTRTQTETEIPTETLTSNP